LAQPFCASSKVAGSYLDVQNLNTLKTLNQKRLT